MLQFLFLRTCSSTYVSLLLFLFLLNILLYLIFRNLVRSSELLLFKLDDALQEARAAQEGMAVYIQVFSWITYGY